MSIIVVVTVMPAKCNNPFEMLKQSLLTL